MNRLPGGDAPPDRTSGVRRFYHSTAVEAADVWRRSSWAVARTSSWNATFSQTGPAVAIGNARWNPDVPPGGSVSPGIHGTWTTSNAAPTALALNGVPCTAG